MIYLLTAIGLTPDDSNTVHIYTVRQNTQNRTYITVLKLTKEYITIRIHNLQN